VRDEAWLKDAALFYDSVSSIVPPGYKTKPAFRTERLFRDAKILQEKEVTFPDEHLWDHHDEIVDLLERSKGPQERHRRAVAAFGDAESATVPARVHVDKVPPDLEAAFDRHCKRDGQWYEVDSVVANVYMACLAEGMARQEGFEPVTDGLNAAFPSFLGLEHPWCQRSAQGLLGLVSIRRLRVHPTTPPEQIILFRHQHRDEMVRFRGCVAEVAQALKEARSPAALRQGIEDLQQKIALEVADLEREARRVKLRVVIELGPMMLKVFMNPASAVKEVPGAIRTIGGFLTRPPLRDAPVGLLLSIQRELVDESRVLSSLRKWSATPARMG
jgi:hypothetical protein